MSETVTHHSADECPLWWDFCRCDEVDDLRDLVICGETHDHTTIITYEDAEITQWRCEECGDEGDYPSD